ncbi:MAG: penicillin-binding protein 1A [Desulfobacterales bacterium]|nr:MAG: penicillin-binding protein 1A [Desulfobacterales bacterium]
MPPNRVTRKYVSFLLLLLGGVLCGSMVGAFFAFTRDLPQIRSLENFQPDAVTRIYSADKVLLAELFSEKRDPVALDVIPHYLTAALVATEDRKFFKHSGVDLKGIARAIVKDIWAREFVEGASTITQQLAKTLFLTSRKNLVRKIKEAILAFQLERRYTKDEILEFYLNQVYFGSGAYGVESAARIFFGKAVQDLSLAECALVAGLPKSPSHYSPLVNEALAVKRRNIVLKQMHDTGIITAAAYQRALQEKLQLASKTPNHTKAPYFVQYIRNFLEDKFGSSRIYRDGLSVYTTLDFKLQKAAEQAIVSGLDALAQRMRPQRIMAADPQAALIALDVPSGGILAMVGGRDYSKSSYNRATTAKRQPGSAIKPLIYAYAVEQGFAQNQMILDAPVVYKGVHAGEDWRPENFSHDYRGEMTLRQALAFSQNIPAVRLLERLGPSAVVRFGKSLGIESPLTTDLSLALGTSEITLIELTSAYTVFANQGKRAAPFGVMQITDRQGRRVWQAKPRKQVVMSRTGAAVMTDMLEGVIREGTGYPAQKLGRPLAGKTGTSSRYKDALFIGFSPAVAAGVWVGLDSAGSLGEKETGTKAALPIWLDFMAAALADQPYRYFDIPDDVVRIHMDPTTGRRVSDDSTGSVTALFKRGTEPRGPITANR